MSDEIRFNDEKLLECGSVQELYPVVATLIIAKFHEDRRVDLLRSEIINKWIRAFYKILEKHHKPNYAGAREQFVSNIVPDDLFSEIINFIYQNKARMLDGVEGLERFEEFLATAFYPLDLSDDQKLAARIRLEFGK